MPAIFYLVYKAIFLQGETLLAFIDCGFISFGFEYLSYNRIRFPMKMKAIRNFGLQVLLIKDLQLFKKVDLYKVSSTLKMRYLVDFMGFVLSQSNPGPDSSHFSLIRLKPLFFSFFPLVINVKRMGRMDVWHKSFA